MATGSIGSACMGVLQSRVCGEMQHVDVGSFWRSVQQWWYISPCSQRCGRRCTRSDECVLAGLARARCSVVQRARRAGDRVEERGTMGERGGKIQLVQSIPNAIATILLIERLLNDNRGTHHS